MTTKRYRVQYTEVMPGGSEYQQDRLMVEASVRDVMDAIEHLDYLDDSLVISVTNGDDGIPVVIYNGATDY